MVQSRKFQMQNIGVIINFKLVLFLVFITIAFCPLHAQDVEVPHTRTFPGIENPSFPYAQPEEVGLSGEKLNRLGDEIESWVVNGELVGGELLIVKDGKAVFHEAYGWADREERRPMERNSIFSIKSMSKPFTATAVLILAEQGKLSLDDLVSRYIPGFAGDVRTTIRHLLTHTSGYTGLRDTGDFDRLRDWVESLARDTPSSPFEEYSYSDFNSAALGYIVETISATTLDVFIEEWILDPLGLDETFTAFTPNAPWAARVNSRYRWNEDSEIYRKYWSNRSPQYSNFYPAAWGLWATAMDYAAFMAMWMNKGHNGGVRLLSEEMVEEALRSHTSFAAHVRGYAWQMKEAPRLGGMPFVFSHGGVDGTLAVAFPAENAIIIYLTQSRGLEHRRALMNRLGMLEIFDGPGPYSDNLVWAGDHEVVEAELTPEEQVRYVGTYRGRNTGGENKPEIFVRVWEEGVRLHIQVGKEVLADWRLHLVPLGGHCFSMGRYRDEQLEAISPVAIRFTVENGRAKTLEVVRENKVLFSGERVDLE